MIIKTATGGQYNTDKKAHSNLITTLSERNPQTTRMQELTIIGIGGTHLEFMEEKTDIIVVDEYGEKHEVCEDFLWQI